MNICSSFRCWWCWTYRWCWCEGYPISMNISQPFYPRNCYYATNLTGTNSAEECLQSCNTWQNEDPRHKTVSFVWSFPWKSESEKLEDHTLEAFCVNLLIRSNPMVGAIEDSNGYEQFIRSCGTLWRLPVSNRQSAKDQDSGAERRGKGSLQIHKDEHKD